MERDRVLSEDEIRALHRQLPSAQSFPTSEAALWPALDTGCRTGATLMTALGVLPEVAEKCLNHTEESRVKRTCQRHSYDAEKLEAWRPLGERLELLTRGNENVVTMRPRRKTAAVVSA